MGQYVRELEIPPSQIDVVSYGKERPFSAEHEEACWQQDRRGHFVVMLSAEKIDPCPAGEIARLVMSSSADKEVVVLDGLSAGERVIVEGMQKARPGSQVNPQIAGVATQTAGG